MKDFLKRTVAVLAVASFALHPSLVQAQIAIGNANKVISRVQGVLQANTRTLVIKDDVYSNERVSTAADGAARFVFQDKTILSVGASSTVTLDEFVFDADASKSKVALSMSKGVMRFVSGNLPKARYSIKTPTAVIGIRGTIVVIAVALNGLTTVTVVEGAVTVSAAGTTATVDAGLSTTVSPGAPPTPPTASPPPSPQVQAMNSSLGPDPGGATETATAEGGGLSAGAIGIGAAIAATSDDDDAVSTSSSTSTSTSTTAAAGNGSSSTPSTTN